MSAKPRLVLQPSHDHTNIPLSTEIDIKPALKPRLHRRNRKDSTPVTTAHVIARRNERERNRVRQVNASFAILRNHLPPSDGRKKLSKVETLRCAIVYIQQMEALLDGQMFSDEASTENYLDVPLDEDFDGSDYSFGSGTSPEQMSIDEGSLPSFPSFKTIRYAPIFSDEPNNV